MVTKIKGSSSKTKPYFEQPNDPPISDVEEIKLDNKVLVCIVGQKLFLLKEKWLQWDVYQAIDIEKLM